MTILTKFLGLSVLGAVLITGSYLVTLSAFSSVERILQNGHGVECSADEGGGAHELLKQLSTAGCTPPSRKQSYTKS